MTVPIIKRNLNLAVMVIVGAALDFFKGLARLLLLLRLFFSRLLLLNLCCNSTWLKKLSSSCEMQILGLFSVHQRVVNQQKKVFHKNHFRKTSTSLSMCDYGFVKNHKNSSSSAQHSYIVDELCTKTKKKALTL